jgi:hypothetical protein
MADRAIAGMAILYLGVVGGSCLLVAFILLLHVWLALWLCFAVGGVVVIVCGLAINLRMRSLAKTAETGVVELRRAGDPSSVG